MRRVATQLRARIVLGVVAGLVLGVAGSAAAESKRVGVPKFDGPQEAVIRKAVMQVLGREGYDVVSSREVDAAARSAGVSLDSNDGYKAVARELSLSSFVTGEVAKKKAKLIVRNGLDGTVSGEGSFAGATPAKVASEIRDGFGRRLGSAVARGRAPSGSKKPVAAPPPPPSDDDEDEAPAPVAAKPLPKAAPAQETKSDESASGESGDSAPDVVEKKAEPPPEDPGEGYAPRALDAMVGFRLFGRSLTFYQDIYNELSDYSLTLGPALAVDAVVMPGSFFTSGIGSYFGLVLSIEQALGVGASLSTGQTLPTIVHDYSGGLAFRLPFSGGSEVLVSGSYGEHAFSLRSGDGVRRADVKTIPDTIYHYARIGLGGRLMLGGGFSLTGKFGYRIVLNKGGQDNLQIGSDGTPAEPNGYFPHLTVQAIDVGAGFGYLIMPSLEIRASFDFRQYGFAMNSQTGDYPDGDFLPGSNNTARVVKVAGGATDQYWGGTVGIAYIFGGVRPGARPVVEEEAPPPEPEKKKTKKKKAKKPADDEDEDGEAAADEDSDD
jgi:hypothetical protein